MIANDPYQPEIFRIDGMTQESNDVFSLNISHQEGKPILFAPGQFNMLQAFGIGESAISISSDPAKNHSITHTIRAVGPVTRHLTELNANQTLAVRGPFGTAWPVEQAKGHSVLLIAGGIGLAPLRPVIYQLLARAHEYQTITVLYGARSPENVIYEDEIKDWQAKMQFEVTVDFAPLTWEGHIGVVTSLIKQAIRFPNNTWVMMCGPEVMMRFCLFELQELSIPPQNIYISMERNMQCGFGQCGHCQWGPYFLCKDGPVVNFAEVAPYFYKKAL